MNKATESSVLVLRADTAPFRDAVVLGQGLPSEKNGQPCRYFWKESLPIGDYLDKAGTPFKVTPDRVENLIRNFNRAKAKGFLPSSPSRHEKDGAVNFGFIVDARKNEKGSLELLHQMIGEDAIKAAARNKSSICTVANVTDETGDQYDELIDHNAVIPDPQLNNLDDFQPALAASRGTTAAAVVLQLASTPTKEIDMIDLKILRETIGAAKEITDEAVIQQAVAKLSEVKGLELSRTTAATELATMKTRAETAEASLATAQTKVLELSRAPDAGILADRADLMCQKIDLAMDKGQCTKAQADILKAALKDGDKPNLLMLSRSGASGTPIDVALKVLELNKAFTGSKSGTQHLPDPNDTKKEVVSPERKKEILAAAGM